MASLKEIKGRISSVRSTLKITSAMKMVASTKLHKAQQAAERCAVYEQELADILRIAKPSSISALCRETDDKLPVAIIAFSSNSSLCGAFNANVYKMASKMVELSGGKDGVVLYAVGKKMAEAFAKAGIAPEGDWSDMAQHPGYSKAGELAGKLMQDYALGRFSKVIMVWNHFVSTSTQKPKVETLLPFDTSILRDLTSGRDAGMDDDYIVEPGREQLFDELLPQVLRLKLYSVLLDSNAAEHAARTVAMQIATDNGNEILSDLTLEYNKGRQAKITAEILDLAGGAQQ